MICNPIRDPVWEQIWSDPVQISSKYRNKQIVIVQIEEQSKLIRKEVVHLMCNN